MTSGRRVFSLRVFGGPLVPGDQRLVCAFDDTPNRNALPRDNCSLVSLGLPRKTPFWRNSAEGLSLTLLLFGSEVFKIVEFPAAASVSVQPILPCALFP